MIQQFDSPDAWLEPQPVADCADCRQLARLRHRAREEADLRTVADANTRFRRHWRAVH